jgi:hypothetical protein
MKAAFVPGVAAGAAVAAYVRSHATLGLPLLPNSPADTKLPCAPLGPAYGAGLPVFKEGEWREVIRLASPPTRHAKGPSVLGAGFTYARQCC